MINRKKYNFFHNRRTFFILFSILVVFIAFFNNEINIEIDSSNINSGDTAWMIIASAFVLLMTPGLAFFYGGMVNKKNIISTMLQSFIALGIISVFWVFIGFSLSFGDSIYGLGIIGDPLQYLNFKGVLSKNENIPFLLFAIFQLKFAVITPALVSGSFAERIRFRSYILFMVLFCLFIYCPLAHMTWASDGLFANFGDILGWEGYQGLHVLDFAGGTVVHMSAGITALCGAFFLGKRRKEFSDSENIKPANIPFVILGTSLLWFGWFGFNAGSSLGSNIDAVIAFANTNIASATSMITWVFYDRFLNRKISAIGACIGAIVGLVAITPAAGFVTIGHSAFIGFTAAIISNIVMTSMKKSKIDDTLDVFASHGVGGITGMILTSVFANKVGLIYGNHETFILHIIALIIVVLFVSIGSYLLYYIIDIILPLRVREDQEKRGLDLSQHGESL